jgi:hypothetical protein
MKKTAIRRSYTPLLSGLFLFISHLQKLDLRMEHTGNIKMAAENRNYHEQKLLQ